MKIIDYKAIKNELNDILIGEVFSSNLAKFNQDIDEKLANFKPTFMVYGDYNCGKSTLLNALFGEEKAPMGDIVTTKQVHSYEYKGFTIYDTPGLSANSQDNDTTAEQLLKSEIVLFVLSNDNIEVNAVYERAAMVLKSKKPILIVVNKKAITDSLEDEKIKNKILSNLRSKISDFESDLCRIISINAHSALKAKLENKKLLLENSKYADFENAVLKLIQTAGQDEVQNALNGYISSSIENFIQICDSGLDNEKEKKIAQIVDFLNSQKNYFGISLENILYKQTIALKSNLLSYLHGENINQGEIEKMLLEAFEKMQPQIENKQKEIMGEISTKIEDYNKEYQAIKQNNIDVDLSVFNKNGDSSMTIPPEIKELIFKNVTDKELIANATKGTLEYIKKTLPELMKGKGPKWIENMSVKIGKWAGPAINAAKGIYDIYSAQKEYEEGIRLQKEREFNIENSAREISENFENSVKEQLKEIEAKSFDNLINTYNQISKSLASKNNNFAQIKERLLQISSKIA